MLGRGQANIDRLGTMAAELGMTAEVASSAKEMMGDVDILVTTVTHTDAGAPFLDAKNMRSGSFLVSVDLAAPWKRDSFVALDRLAVDDLAQEQALPNKLCDPAHITGDLTALVLGKTNGRETSTDRTAFVFRGHALGDLALSALAWETHLNG